MTPFDLCPADDPLHARYHRRSKILLGTGRLAAILAILYGFVGVVAFPASLWIADWELCRRSLAALFVGAVLAAIVRLCGKMDSALFKLEVARLAKEHTSVAAEAERFLNRTDESGGYA